MKTNIEETNTKEDLIFNLEEFDIALPPVGRNGRTTDHDERLAICMLLSTLAQADELTYPLSLEHKDKPDFRLKEVGGTTGIEVTFAMNQNHRHFKARMNKLSTQKVYSTNVFQPNQTLSKNEIESYLIDNFSIAPLMGNKPYKNWAYYVTTSINKKVIDFNKSDFEKFSKNVLVVFVETPERVAVTDVNKAIEYLLPYLPTVWAKAVRFDCIYIQHYEYIIKLEFNKPHQCFVANDIWGFFS
jgi:hypothetical protein